MFLKSVLNNRITTIKHKQKVSFILKEYLSFVFGERIPLCIE